MSFGSKPSSIGWLKAVVSDKRSRIAALLGEMTGLGVPGLMKPALFRKFLDLLAQVDSEREQEEDYLVQIEQVELQHRFNREHSRLKRADPAFEPQPKQELENKNTRKDLWRFLDFIRKPKGA